MATDREPFFKDVSPGPEDDRFLRPRPAGASDGGLLDDFDQEFSQRPLDDADFKPEEGMKVFHQNPLAQRSRRDSDYARVENKAGQHWGYAEKSPATQARTPEEEAAHKLQLRDETRYLHGGQELSDEEGQNWDQNWRDRVAYDSRALKVAEPGAGWDKPKVGKFRSAMSWLGNKLTFGMLGGKDYRARQETLKQREALVKSAFTQRMTRFDEAQYDLNNEDAENHGRAKRFIGDRYIGRQPRIRPQRQDEDYMKYRDRRNEALENDVAGNQRYNNAPQWIKDSKFGRNAWDRLVSDSAGIGKKRMRVLDDFDD